MKHNNGPLWVERVENGDYEKSKVCFNMGSVTKERIDRIKLKLGVAGCDIVEAAIDELWRNLDDYEHSIKQISAARTMTDRRRYNGLMVPS